MAVLVSDAPANFAAVSVTQIFRADREMFSFLAAEHSESLKPVTGKEPPMDRTFKRLMHDPRINVHLIAYPKQQQPVHKTPKRPADESGDRTNYF